MKLVDTVYIFPTVYCLCNSDNWFENLLQKTPTVVLVLTSNVHHFRYAHMLPASFTSRWPLLMLSYSWFIQAYGHMGLCNINSEGNARKTKCGRRGRLGPIHCSVLCNLVLLPSWFFVEVPEDAQWSQPETFLFYFHSVVLFFLMILCKNLNFIAFHYGRMLPLTRPLVLFNAKH